MLSGLVGVLALVSAVYCFWLMTVPLSYDLVYVVVIGFVVSLGILVAALISSFIFVRRLRQSDHAPRSPQTPPPA